MVRLFSPLVALVAVLNTATLRAQLAAPQPQGPVSPAVARLVRGEAPKPRLVVVLSIDQFRADYLTRMSGLFLPPQGPNGPGGFRTLMERGAWFVEAHYGHYPLFTGPGHAVILSGADPYKSGIVSNDWWDPKLRKPVHSVDDDRYTVVGAGPSSTAKPMGPRNMLSSTVGDELKLATAGHAKVVTLALKDRAAILLGGHAQDSSIWFDLADGRWISSTAFCRNGKLPPWAEKVNEERIPDRALGTQWICGIGPEILRERTLVPRFAGKDIPEGMGATFPHTIGTEKTRANYKAFILTPSANEFVLSTAARAVQAEGLGLDEVPDILAINLSTNDYVGHAWGPLSPEALDVTVQTDRQLGRFLAFLETAVPGGMNSIVFVLTADHGVTPIPEDAQAMGIPAGRYSIDAVVNALTLGLTARFGPPEGGTWFSTSREDPKKNAAFLDGFVYLSDEAMAKLISSGAVRNRGEIEDAACEALNSARIPGVYRCYGKHQVLEGRIADNDIARHLARSVHPNVSSDLIIVQDQMWLPAPDPEGHATSHATPYAYDTHVPLILCAPGLVKPGVYTQRCSPADIAPTLSLLLGIELPSGSEGRVLGEALSE